ncbi:GFA domain-containing protein [Mycena sanguinolenta]|uniref:GFA domain-containing protein n=1 Tax=Mycena sanguinolenta TaxID=230812 RepID=A0A8H7CVR3_9AGAR|nr:GFA domain-containing protein [Mycena sanguinolenta]
MPHQGKCLCGQTTIKLNSTHTEQIVCHCLDCKQTSGSAFSTNVLAPKKDVIIEGPVKEYTIKAASGNPVTRVFCSNCGSAISHLTVAFGDAQAIQTGNFGDFAQVPVTTELFVKDRWTGLQAITGAAQVNAMPS